TSCGRMYSRPPLSTVSQSRVSRTFFFFFFNHTAPTEIYTLSLHDALPIFAQALQELGAAMPLVQGRHGRRLQQLLHGGQAHRLVHASPPGASSRFGAIR